MNDQSYKGRKDRGEVGQSIFHISQLRWRKYLYMYVLKYSHWADYTALSFADNS